MTVYKAVASRVVSWEGGSLLAATGINISGAGIALTQDASAQSVVASTNSGVVLTSGSHRARHQTPLLRTAAFVCV
ncbi:hypothetical protein ACW9YQ_17020 (plasmid) [Paraburkholderia strydomiana]